MIGVMCGVTMSGLRSALLVVSIIYLFSDVAVVTAIEENVIQPEPDPKRPIYCYQCNSAVDVDCPFLEANNTNSIHYQPCNETKEYNGQMPFCRKIVQTIFERNNMVRVIRKCGWEKHQKHECYFASNDDHLEAVCQCFTDGCNTAAIGTLAVPLVVASVISYLLVS